jgi:hypothetical protein
LQRDFAMSWRNHIIKTQQEIGRTEALGMDVVLGMVYSGRIRREGNSSQVSPSTGRP